MPRLLACAGDHHFGIAGIAGSATGIANRDKGLESNCMTGDRDHLVHVVEANGKLPGNQCRFGEASVYTVEAQCW